MFQPAAIDLFSYFFYRNFNNKVNKDKKIFITNFKLIFTDMMIKL